MEKILKDKVKNIKSEKKNKMNSSNVGYVDPCDFSKVVKKLREFSESKDFIEVHTQSRISILAACEDPLTISRYDYAGNTNPLPQTGQMWLEYELLTKPHIPGFYCVSTSYRNEPSPIEGRHDLIFPMFEFELKGDMHDLVSFEKDMLRHLGFKEPYFEGNYRDIIKKYDTKEVEHEHEAMLEKDYGPVFFLKYFPTYTSPFWNMKLADDQIHANKVDVILHGMETIGSAERSTNREEMRKMFHTISGGEYADILYNNFGKKRVENELEDFLSHDFFPRVGGGIGITRLIRAMKLSKLI